MSDATPTRALTWPAVRKLVLQAIIVAVLAAAAIAIFAIIAGTFAVLEQKLLAVVLVFLGFAFFALFDAAVLSRRNDRLALVSVAVALFLLVVGVLKVALADPSDQFATHGVWPELWSWIGLAFVDRVALLWVWLLDESRRSVRRPILRVLAVATTALVVVLAVLLSLPLLVDRGDFPNPYWRATAVAGVLSLLGTALLPLLAWFFRSRTPVAVPPPGSRRLAWPLYDDGTPLPADADGRPDYSEVLQPPATPGATTGPVRP
ncbi:MAG TPA: hypothetical protein VGO26_01635 [Amnibacterium sp.]|jgi:hypothetical protein|nr:hypothetical protein [Amnibacterium sp.]